jgi:hypothetical protein
MKYHCNPEYIFPAVFVLRSFDFFLKKTNQIGRQQGTLIVFNIDVVVEGFYRNNIGKKIITVQFSVHKMGYGEDAWMKLNRFSFWMENTGTILIQSFLL